MTTTPSTNAGMDRSEILDPPYETTTVAHVGDGYITTEDGWSIRCPLDGVQVGYVVEQWGRGIGYPLRGMAVGGRVAWYRTEAQEEQHRLAELAAMDDRRKREFEEKRAEYDAAFAALPECFQQRVQRFRDAAGPSWRWEFEPYELMVCTDAVRIAEFCAREHISIGVYAALPYEQQKAAGIDGGHSGNSFGFAVQLARLWPNPKAVVAMHGALTPLVGCEAYGCTHELVAS